MKENVRHHKTVSVDKLIKCKQQLAEEKRRQVKMLEQISIGTGIPVIKLLAMCEN